MRERLSNDYRKIRDENKKTGAATKSWKFSEALDPVLGCKPATIPPLLIDTLAEEGVVEINDDSKQGSPSSTNSDTVGLSPPDLTTDTYVSPQLKSSSDEASESSSSTTVKLLPKKRATKAKKIDRVLTGVVESIVTAQLKG